MNRRTKIVCTLGPAVGTQDQVNRLVAAGMDVARLNFSHGTHAEHARAYDRVRTAATAAPRPIGVLADLQGPKIRLGTFAEGPVTWRRGDRVAITVEAVRGTAARVSTTYRGLPDDVSAGDRLLVDDGNVELRVEEVVGGDVVCRVVEGGPVSDHKGISLPDVDVRAPAFTDKDAADLRFALSLGVEAVALSFVRRPADVAPVRQILAEQGADTVMVIAKLEKPQAVQDLAGIVAAFDGIMVARGDLGVEMPLEDVPLVQKRAITLARTHAKPVIVATQMLESMMHRSRPSRAEASDVANAVFDGTDALMLSGETSVGQHPVAAVETMARIARAAESGAAAHLPALHAAAPTLDTALAGVAVDVAAAIRARLIVAFTESGDAARQLARHRPSAPLLAFTTRPSVQRQLALSWGVEPFLVPAGAPPDRVRWVDAELRRLGRAAPGDLTILVTGSGRAPDLLRVHSVT